MFVLKTNIESKTTNRGFTIVELLIVIVVIGILAAITMVSYNGIQNRSKTAAGQQLASNVAKKIQAYYTVESSYPASAAAMAAVDEAELEDESSVTFAANTSGFNGSAANGGKVVLFNTTNHKVYYWDYTENPQAAKPIN